MDAHGLRDLFLVNCQINFLGKNRNKQNVRTEVSPIHLLTNNQDNYMQDLE